MSIEVVHFTTVHPPLDGRIFAKECRSLAAAGYSVTLVATNAPDEPIDGVRFVRIEPVAGGRVKRALLGNVRLTRLLLRQRADVYHFHDPELLPVGLLLRAMRRRVIYDAHEHVRDDIRSKPYIRRWMKPVILATVGGLESLMARTGTHVVAATETIAGQFPPDRTTVVRNYPIVDEISAGPASLDEYVARPAIGLYAGAMSPLRHADEMFAAADLVHGDRPTFALMTAGPTFQVDDPAVHAGVDYLGTVSRARVAELLGEARFGVMLLADAPNCADGFPTKFFEYAAAGLPVVVSRSTVGIARIVDEVRCGIAVDERSPRAIAEAMRWLLDHPADAFAMGRRGEQAVRSMYGWATEADAMLDAYRRSVGSPA